MGLRFAVEVRIGVGMETGTGWMIISIYLHLSLSRMRVWGHGGCEDEGMRVCEDEEVWGYDGVMDGVG